MSELDALRDVAREIRPPAYDDLVTVARRRRRGSALAVVGVLALVVGIGAATTALPDDRRSAPPVVGPTDPPSARAWTPERIREEGEPEVILETASGLRVRQWSACEGEEPCGPDRRALELTRATQAGLFDVDGTMASFAPVWVHAVGEETVLVQDAPGEYQSGPVRFRLLNAAGDSAPVEVGDPVPAVPGPDVVAVDDLGRWSQGMDGGQVLHRFDGSTGTLRPLDVPGESMVFWWPDTETVLWGAAFDCRVLWSSGGPVATYEPPCAEEGALVPISDAWVPDGWVRDGRLAAVELVDSRALSRLVVHVSLDGGRTWRSTDLGAMDDERWTAQVRGVLQDAL